VAGGGVFSVLNKKSNNDVIKCGFFDGLWLLIKNFCRNLVSLLAGC